jgi:tripartite-type tricarboxylate transporter receptor subunit TctC
MRNIFLSITFIIFGFSQIVLADYPDKAIRIIVPYKAGGGTGYNSKGICRSFQQSCRS